MEKPQQEMKVQYVSVVSLYLIDNKGNFFNIYGLDSCLKRYFFMAIKAWKNKLLISVLIIINQLKNALAKGG